MQDGAEAKSLGRAAGREGKTKLDNPFSMDSPSYHEWIYGLHQGYAEQNGAVAQAQPEKTADHAPREGEPLIAPSNEDHPMYETIVDAIRSVYDPEIPVNIFELGLIYSVRIDKENAVEVDMTLTAPGCPVAGEMPGWVADAIEPLPGVKHVDVNLIWEPPWDMSRLTDEARLELGFM